MTHEKQNEQRIDSIPVHEEGDEVEGYVFTTSLIPPLPVFTPTPVNSDISLNYGKIETTYTQQKPDGTVTK